MRLGVPFLRAVIVVAAAGLLPAAVGAQQTQFPCDADDGGAVTAEEAQVCAAQRFDLARGSADGLAEAQFAAALPDAAGLREQFGRVDQDGNGRISRDEWVAWFGAAYAAMRTTNGAQGGTD